MEGLLSTGPTPSSLPNNGSASAVSYAAVTAVAANVNAAVTVEFDFSAN